MIERVPPTLASWVLKQWRDARPPACMGPGPLTGR